MKKSKIKIYVLELLLIVILFFAFFSRNTITRGKLSIFLFCYMIITSLILKKRLFVSKNKVTYIMTAFALSYIAIFYVFGIFSGFRMAKILLSVKTTLTIIVPLIVIIISSEIIRNIFLAQKKLFMKKNLSQILTFISMVLIDLVISINIYDLYSLKEFWEALGVVIIASISCNLLYNYISIRFGFISVIIYRLITSLYIYIIPIVPDIYIFFESFFKMIYPYLIYLILETKYTEIDFAIPLEMKKKHIFLNIIMVICMILTIMLISCEFQYGLLVVGSKSMENTINKGDAVIYEKYNSELIDKGQVIIFNYNGIKTIHRVLDIKNYNGEYRVYTKGDANSRMDAGYRTQNDIEGIVILKVKYIGYPTLFIHKLFA